MPGELSCCEHEHNINSVDAKLYESKSMALEPPAAALLAGALEPEPPAAGIEAPVLCFDDICLGRGRGAAFNVAGAGDAGALAAAAAAGGEAEAPGDAFEAACPDSWP